MKVSEKHANVANALLHAFTMACVSPVLGVLIGLGSVQAGQSDDTFNWRAAKAKAVAASRPRSFPPGAETSKLFRELQEGVRHPAFQMLLERVDRKLGKHDWSALAELRRVRGSSDEVARFTLNVQATVEAESWSTQEVGFAALVTGQLKYKHDAMARLRAMASLDVRGVTSVTVEDLSARAIAWTLALGYDWFYHDWTPAERKMLRDAIDVRMEDFAAKLIRGPRPFINNPLVSHDNEVLGALAEIAILLIGDLPRAELWFDEFVPLYTRTLTPFGGDDGGYANGTAYALWDMGGYSLRHWDSLRKVIGLDLTTKKWSQNFGRFIAYFLPPGAPVGVFGNGTEVPRPEVWGRYSKAYAMRVPSPLNQWYAKQWSGEDSSRLELLTAPLVNLEASLPANTPSSAVFPSIGWAALHSDLRDPRRTSLYFKSSPFGSVSHSHADQNSFILHARGRQLLVASGYYDFFGSAHHFGWTTRTVAHNALTVDDGIGQEDPARPWGSVARKGTITQFSTSAEVDVVAGDATAAYGGRLQVAARGIVYVRPDMFLVFDYAQSDVPRKWEWNLHALGPFVEVDDHTVRVQDADADACIHFASNGSISFEQKAGFVAPPVRTAQAPRPDQWHGRFVTAKSRELRSVAVIRVGCADGTELAGAIVESEVVRVGERTFGFDGRFVSVQFASARKPI
jgi:hypothetical protein